MFNRKLLVTSALALAAVAVVMSAGAAFAQTTTPVAPTAPVLAPTTTAAPMPVDPAASRYDTRQAYEHNRIQDGKANGSLTPREARKLRIEQQDIRMRERRAEKDGVVTPKEERKLNNMQDRASQDIYQQKHDSQGAMSSNPRP